MGSFLAMGRDIRAVPPVPENVAVAIFVGLICGICAFAAAAWQARIPLPVSYPRAPVASVSAKEMDRVETSWSVHRVPTIAYRLDPPATKAEAARWAPMPWTCAEIRAYAKTHTEAEMHAKAVEHRLTPQQRAIARACLEARR